MPVGDVCRQIGISEATFDVWKKKYADLGVAELRQLRQLTEKNARLKRIGADLTLDKQILQEVIKKRSDASAQKGDRDVDPRDCQRPPAIRVGTHHGDAAARGLAGWPQAGAAPVKRPRRRADAHRRRQGLPQAYARQPAQSALKPGKLAKAARFSPASGQ